MASFTQYAREDLICDSEKAHTPIVGAYREVSLFQDRPQTTKDLGMLSSSHILQISWCMLLTYSLPSGHKQLSREAVRPCSLVVFESLYRNSDLGISSQTSSIGACWLSSLVAE